MRTWLERADVASRPAYACGMAVRINGVKVFSATMALDRARLGETITEWIVRHPNLSIVDVVQTQSSDEWA